MSQTFQQALHSHREAASLKFRNFTRPAPSSAPPPATATPAYIRNLTPDLQSYISSAAARYETHKQSPTPPATTRKSLVHTLGEGPHPPSSLFAHRRKLAWREHISRREHLRRAWPIHSFVDFVLPCAIPSDVRALATRRFRDRGASRAAVMQPKSCVTVGGRVGDVVENCTLLTPVRELSGYDVHISRCRAVLTHGGLFLLRGGEQVCVRDTFEEVRERYAGMPDEIYRRKTARRFATWRRCNRQKMQDMARRAVMAENEMKRRRGYDRLQTDRVHGDASFVPFVYELNSNAFAFSSKISQAPKLRRMMLDKYSAKHDISPQVNLMDKAQQAAENNPLFHMRVMNRFT